MSKNELSPEGKAALLRIVEMAEEIRTGKVKGIYWSELTPEEQETFVDDMIEDDHSYPLVRATADIPSPDGLVPKGTVGTLLETRDQHFLCEFDKKVVVATADQIVKETVDPVKVADAPEDDLTKLIENAEDILRDEDESAGKSGSTA